MVDGRRGIKKGSKKIPPDISDVSGVFIEAVKHILDMHTVYPQKLFFYKLCGIFFAGNVDGGFG